MSYDHVLLHGCEIVEAGGMLIVPYPEFVPLNTIVYAEDVDYSDDDHNYVEEEHVADEAEVQPSRKRKREGNHDKYISYHEANNKYNVNVYMDGQLHHVGLFPTMEEAVFARDAFLRGETVIKPAVKENRYAQKEAPSATATVVYEQIFLRSKDTDDLNSVEKKEVIQSEDEREDVGFESFSIETDESES